MPNFRASARTVDMLGRQQIAGIPTAISELFKNAFDAYADNAIADFIRNRDLFVLRDDGVGMTREEFVERWLTLGTGSKLSVGALPPPPVDPDKPRRPVLGEKGIGRLAIASIGPQVLILTRSRFDAHENTITAAFINWTLFECPGITLDDIEVPISSITGSAVRRSDVLKLVGVVRENVQALEHTIGTERAHTIREQLDRFDVNPSKLEEQLGAPTLSGSGHGVHFYIAPTDRSLAASLGRPGDKDPGELQRVLLGFNNTMTPGHPQPALTVEFFDHRAPGSPSEEMIGPRVFFTEEDFATADHHISGRFDDFGQFEGTVAVYRQPPVPYLVAWPRAMGTPTACGPFKVNLAYVQGARADSGLDPESYALISEKLRRWGGVYVYRDGIRVLPYGTSDNDWLAIEENRTKSASYYFFSYRRMLGAVEITRAENAGLEEKAGREGFRTNDAYRQFSDILRNFFPQLAADFFREDANVSQVFVQKRMELNAIELARRRRDSQVRARRAAFRTDLDDFFRRVGEGEPERLTREVLDDLRRALAAATAISDPDEAAVAVIDAELAARGQLERTLAQFRPSRPRGVSLAREMYRDLAAYRSELTRLDRDVFTPAMNEIDRVTLDAADEARLAIDRRLRFDKGLSLAAEEARRRTRSLSQTANAAAGSVREQVVQLAHDTLRQVELSATAVLAEAARTDVSKLGDADLVAVRLRLEAELDETAVASQEFLEAIRTRLETLAQATDRDDWIVAPDEVTAAVEEELMELRERSDMDLELAQLGMAVEVINHEFESTIKAIRSNLGELKLWADANADLEPLYSGIRTSFEHLDGYLTLFTPLHRRLYRSATDFTGSDIFVFLEDLFRQRLERHSVSIVASAAFRRFTIHGYPSTFYPVFVNLIDNALFWLDRAQGERIINLDVAHGGMVISDTGEGVSTRDRDAIFELGFTRKPGGRGLGLYISRQVLEKAGWQIRMVDWKDRVAFLMAPADPVSDA
jgi:signal transduction histidine kinase